MFNEYFYARFDVTRNCGFTLYEKGVPLYGKNVDRAVGERYDSLADFKVDLDDAFRKYMAICHKTIVYDSFTDSMKAFIDEYHEDLYLCEIQGMTKKRLFQLFDGAPVDLLYEVACHLFLYHNSEDSKDEHEESFD